MSEFHRPLAWVGSRELPVAVFEYDNAALLAEIARCEAAEARDVAILANPLPKGGAWISTRGFWPARIAVLQAALS